MNCYQIAIEQEVLTNSLVNSGSTIDVRSFSRIGIDEYFELYLA